MTAEEQRMALFYASPFTTFTSYLVKMNDALEQVRQVIGEEDISGLPDSEVKDTIWYYHFNVEESINWCLRTLPFLISQSTYC